MKCLCCEKRLRDTDQIGRHKAYIKRFYGVWSPEKLSLHLGKRPS